MLPQRKDESLRRFYSPFNCKSYDICLPDVLDKRCWGSSHGWLVTLGANFEMHLLNPLSRGQISLPPLHKCPNLNLVCTGKSFRDSFVYKVILSASPSSSDCVIFAIYSANWKMAFTKPGDVAWTPLSCIHGHVDDAMCHDGKFYAIDTFGEILMWDLAGSLLKRIAFPPSRDLDNLVYATTYLVEVNGQIYAIMRLLFDTRITDTPCLTTWCFKIYNLDICNEKCEEVKSLGDWSIFVGNNHSFSIPSSTYPECESNCIYFTDDFSGVHYSVVHGYDMGIYRVQNLSVQPLLQEDVSDSAFSLPLWIIPSLSVSKCVLCSEFGPVAFLSMQNYRNDHILKIPVAFSKHLKGCNQEHAILRKAGKKWQVKVNGRLLEEGWAKFAKEHDLQLGDCLIFRHEGNLEFEVSIFGSNHFEREYKQTREGGEEINHTCKKIISQAKTTEKPKLNIKSHEIVPKVEAAENMPLGRPHFIYTVTPYCLTRDHVQLPVSFAREHSLTNRKCTITIRDEQRSWTFTLYSSGAHTYIKGKWSEFCIANCLKKGDQIMLEIVENGMNPVLRFYDLRANASLQLEGKKPNLDAEKVSSRRKEANVPASTSANANSQFVSIIQPYAIIRALFYLPLAFARPNGLMRRCKMILKDEKQRSWSVQLGEVGPRFAITKGWRQFREANAVQVGDTYKFELIDNGTTPIAYFHRTRENASFQPKGKKPNLDAKRVSARSNEADVPASTCPDANPQFVSTINPYCIHSPFLYLPSAFAKSNGLVNRRCKMILRDEKQRSWSVLLAPMGHHIAITKGWRQFREANGVQVGDTYKFELIDNGMIPIAYFHCKYSGKDAKPSERH
ncbi:hypothetical protein KY289_034637 [Solanum tuberosum]|nr:hypothetical protein KY289_034637 [Solanum tuberosum]